MILGIMQPYFFPYSGYFELIAKSDRWIVFDIVQYNPKSWMNRNRILRPDTGWQYINVPVRKTEKGTAIHDIRVIKKSVALAKIKGQLRHYKKHAPYYNQVVELIQRSFDTTTSERLADLNIATLSTVCDYLNIRFDHARVSMLDLDLAGINDPGHWALAICQQLGATAYINPPGGRTLFNTDDWSACGIDLQILEPANFEYDCRPYQYVPNLSIIDVLMWNEPVVVKAGIQAQQSVGNESENNDP